MATCPCHRVSRNRHMSSHHRIGIDTGSILCTVGRSGLTYATPTQQLIVYIRSCCCVFFYFIFLSVILKWKIRPGHLTVLLYNIHIQQAREGEGGREGGNEEGRKVERERREEGRKVERERREEGRKVERERREEGRKVERERREEGRKEKEGREREEEGERGREGGRGGREGEERREGEYYSVYRTRCHFFSSIYLQDVSTPL